MAGRAADYEGEDEDPRRRPDLGKGVMGVKMDKWTNAGVGVWGTYEIERRVKMVKGQRERHRESRGDSGVPNPSPGMEITFGENQERGE